MYLTTHELVVVPSVVTGIAIVAGFTGVWATNRNQRWLARDQYVRGHLTETYLRVLRAVHSREMIVDEVYRQPKTVPLNSGNRTSEDEAAFMASLRAYSSDTVYDLWLEFDKRTNEVKDFLIRLRRQHDAPATQLARGELGPDIEAALEGWRERRRRLTDQVRKELEFGS
jgi:hypothetical protein